MEVSGKMLTRKGIVEREKAMSTARNVKDSKFGNALLKNNFQQNRLLVSTLGRLDNQLKRQQMHIDQQKKCFLNRRLPFPSIIVERPTSPEKFYDSDSDASSENDGIPGYMKPMKTRAKKPFNLSTIDAFVLKTKKKANVWEEAMDRTVKPQFQSKVLPSPPLTEEEKMDLQAGWMYHRPPSRGTERRTLSPSPRSTTNTTTVVNSHRIKAAIKCTDLSVAITDDLSEVSGTFVTQRNHFRYNTDNLVNKRTTKTVKFSSDISVIQEKPPPPAITYSVDKNAAEKT